MTLGLLALQGDFAAHGAVLAALGVPARQVRRVHELAGLAGLVIPGGESTTLLNLMRDEPWFEALRAYHAGGGAILGTCAGAILLARRVLNPVQPSLGLLDVTVERNAYGRQIESFEAELDLVGSERKLRAAFIRAPRFVEIGAGVEVLASLGAAPVLVRQGRVVACTFHSELTGDSRVHELFAAMVGVPWPRHGSTTVAAGRPQALAG